MDVKNYQSIETLRDGRRVVIRAIRPDDKASLVEGFSHLSNTSVHHRFLVGRQTLHARELAYLTELDFKTHVALVAAVGEEVSAAPAGVARFIVDAEAPEVADVAFTVVDEYQGLGIATRCLAHLVAIARQLGVREFRADVLRENSAMMSVLRQSGLPMQVYPGSDLNEVRLTLLATP